MFVPNYGSIYNILRLRETDFPSEVKILWFDQNFTLYQTLEDKKTIFSEMLYTTPNEGLVGMPLVVKVTKCKHVYGSLTSQKRVIMG